MQSNTGHQNRGNRHQGHALLGARTVAPKRGTDKGAFVFAKQFFYALESNRIHIPCITRKILNLLDGAVIWSMKSVIHAGVQTQSDKATALPIRPIFFRAEQVLQRVWKAFGLKYFCPLDASVSTNDAINRALSPLIVRAPSLSSRVKQSCMLVKLGFLASRRSRSEKNFQIPIDVSRTQGCSILLNQPINLVRACLGRRLVSKKFRFSCASRL
jgi:hypothetical protein